MYHIQHPITNQFKMIKGKILILKHLDLMREDN